MTNTIIVIYLFIILFTGVLAGKNINGLKDYAVAGKSFGTLIIFATLSASFIGGGFSLGNAEKVFLVGIANIVALWGFSLKEILVAKYIVPKMDKYPEAISVGDIIEPHYGKNARIFTGVFAVLLCAGILGAQVGAIGYIFNLFLGIERFWGIIIGCGIVIIYATIGGMKSVVWTDVIQFVVLAIGIPLTLFIGLEYVGGWESMTQKIPASRLELATSPEALLTIGALFLTFLLGETLVPPYVQRLLIGKTTKDVSKGTFLSGFFSIPFFAITGLIGLVALAINPDINPNYAMPYVIKETLPPFLQGIVIAAIISIVMSSADSFLNASSIAFINDIVKPLKKRSLEQKTELQLARGVTLFVGILSVVFAISIESILDILIYAYNFWAPTVLIPLAAAILGFYVSTKRFIAGAVAGITGALIWNVALHAPMHVDGLVIGAFANMAAFFLIEREKAKEYVINKAQ